MKNKILEIVKNSDFEILGLRKDDKLYNVGDILENSHQLFQDPQYTDDSCQELLYPYISSGCYAGFYDGGELDGTCALEIRKDNIDQIINDIKQYDGKNMYLIAGNYYSYGNDDNEVVIKEAEVIAVL